MSLHSAKGLGILQLFLWWEWKKGLLPHSRAMFSEKEIEEERRLCYVGITRAKGEAVFSVMHAVASPMASPITVYPVVFLSEIDQRI